MKALVLKPLTKVFSMAVDIRHWLYKKEVFRSQRVRVPVISVGNITLGGTGKTPFVDIIVKYLIEKNKTVGLVSRGYGAKEKKRGIIDQSQRNFGLMADQYGDEPTMLQSKNPKLFVCVNPDRFQGSQELISKKAVDVIVADDAFQHLALHRDLDVVLIDATEKLENLQMLPLGRMREDFAALDRADLIILNKVNLVAPEKILQLRSLLNTKEILEADYEFDGFYHLDSGVPMVEQPLDKYLIVSGIANNESFLKMCRDKFAGMVCGDMGFNDHHIYRQSDINMILNKAKELGAHRILITEKDAVKISQWKSNLFVYSVLKLSIKDDGRKLYDQIDQIIS